MYQVVANVTGTLHKQLSWLRVAPVEEKLRRKPGPRVPFLHPSPNPFLLPSPTWTHLS